MYLWSHMEIEFPSISQARVKWCDVIFLFMYSLILCFKFPKLRFFRTRFLNVGKRPMKNRSCCRSPHSWGWQPRAVEHVFVCVVPCANIEHEQTTIVILKKKKIGGHFQIVCDQQNLFNSASRLCIELHCLRSETWESSRPNFLYHKPSKFTHHPFLHSTVSRWVVSDVNAIIMKLCCVEEV